MVGHLGRTRTKLSDGKICRTLVVSTLPPSMASGGLAGHASSNAAADVAISKPVASLKGPSLPTFPAPCNLPEGSK